MMSELKVYQVISGDLWAGAENQCLQLCTRLQKSGVQVYPVLFNDGDLSHRLQAIGLPVLIWDENVVSPIEMIKLARSVITRTLPAIVHAHGPKEALVFGVAKTLTKSRVRIVRTIHGSSEHHICRYNIKKQFIGFARKFTDNYLIDHFIAVSPELENALLKSNRVDKISAIVNAIDCSNLVAIEETTANEDCRAKILRLGMFARLVDVKRHDLAITALALLDDAAIEGFSSIELHIFGEGPLLSSLADLSKSLHLSERVTFHGFTSKATVAMRSMNAMLMPSDHEGTPMALLESMALGIPVIGHNVGGIKDIISTTKQGVLVEQQSAQGYAAAIVRFCQLLPSLNSNRESALAKFRQRYDIDKMCAQHIALYERLVRNRT